MAQVQKRMGVFIASGLSVAVLGLAAVSVMTGDITLRFAGVHVQMKNDTERGVVIKIEGAECPGKGCPAFALDWKASRTG